MPVDLYDHQREAVEKLRSGSILCGGVGSGKSRTALAYFFTKICGGSFSAGDVAQWYIRDNVPLYIITTARKRDTFEWDKEAALFRIFSETECSIGNVKMVIDSWNNIGKYTDVKDAFFIFDEQRLVGSGAWVKSFLKISKNNRWILLSATPGDTWSDYIPVFIANGFYKNRTEFLKKHAIFNRFSKFPKIDRYVGEEMLTKFRDEVVVPMPVERSTVSSNEFIFTQYDRNTYDRAYKDRWYEDEPISTVSELCYILRKISNSDQTRISALYDIYVNKSKVIVFYNFDYELEMLRTLCDTKTISYGEWNGHKHDPIPSDEKWLYLVQYTAGAEGWNCTETDTICFYSLNYSYKVMKQASGRIDRINTSYTNLYYYILMSESSIDRAIYNAVSKKKTFNESLFTKFN